MKELTIVISCFLMMTAASFLAIEQIQRQEIPKVYAPRQKKKRRR